MSVMAVTVGHRFWRPTTTAVIDGGCHWRYVCRGNRQVGRHCRPSNEKALHCCFFFERLFVRGSDTEDVHSVGQHI